METSEARLSTRPAVQSDRRFCYEVKRAALGPYVEQTWGWDEAFQQEFHTADWQWRRPDIIVLDGEDVGTLQYVRRERDYHLGEFYLLPQHHRRGIGSRLLRRMLDRADAGGFPVRLEVIKINPAKSLYERHGFRVCGETATHYQMVRPERPRHSCRLLQGEPDPAQPAVAVPCPRLRIARAPPSERQQCALPATPSTICIRQRL